MKMYNPDTGELVQIDSLEPRGDILVIKGVIFGAMPMEAELRPEEVRQAFRLLTFRTILFLISLPFRRSTGSAA